MKTKHIGLFAMLFGAIFLLSSMSPAPKANMLPVCECDIYSVDINKDFQFGTRGYFSANISHNGECDVLTSSWVAYDGSGNPIYPTTQANGFARFDFPQGGTYSVCITHTLAPDGTTNGCLVETYCENFTI